MYETDFVPILFSFKIFAREISKKDLHDVEPILIETTTEFSETTTRQTPKIKDIDIGNVCRPIHNRYLVTSLPVHLMAFMGYEMRHFNVKEYSLRYLDAAVFSCVWKHKKEQRRKCGREDLYQFLFRSIRVRLS